MTNLKLSSKMHLFIIISCVLITIGIVVGIICQFVANGFFNYGGEFKSYDTIEVNYAYVDYSEEDKVLDICDKVFDENNVSYFGYSSGDTDDGGRIIYKFTKGKDEQQMRTLAEKVQTALMPASGSTQSTATFHTQTARLNGKKVMTYASIALASAVVLQFLYLVVRYKLTMAIGAFLANIHNLALYVALLAMTRIPTGISAVAFGVLTVLLTMIASGIFFDRYRRNLKKEKYERTPVGELTDICFNESFFSVLYPAVGIATFAVVLLVLLSISALSIMTIGSVIAVALFAVISALYGTMFFMPPVYTRIKAIGDKVKARSKNKK